MKFNPESASNLIPDGEYDAEIAVAEETTSKSGKDMLKLTLKVWAGGGGPRTVYDYIVNPVTIWRLKQLAAAIGKQDLFASGEMGARDLGGESVRVAVKIDKDKKGQFEDKNVIGRYLAPAAGASHAPGGTPAGSDDDIPF